MFHAHGRDLRKGRVSVPGQIYAVTTVTRGRYPFFTDLRYARRLIWVLQQAQALEQATTLCYVIMPDHLHWLLRLGDRQPLQRVVRDVKAVSSRQIGIPIWQKGFYDRAIRDDQDVVSVARYLIGNPLRANLVERIGDYPHWDAAWL